MKKISILTILCISILNPAFSSWVVPPEFVVIEGSSRGHFIRKDNLNKKMEVRLAEDLTEEWSVVIPDYDSLFSTIKLSESGDRIIHVLGDHQIIKIDQDCIQIFGKEGEILSYSLEEFIDNLATIETTLMTSTAPKYHWIEKVNYVTEDRLEFQLSDGRNVVVSIRERKIIMIQ